MTIVLKREVKISVVDDEPAVRQSLRRLLRSVGLNAQTFASGREFLATLEQQHPDCVILDLHLPEMSGLEVQAELVRKHPSLPVIIITGRDDPGLSERALASGAVAYLKKPVDEQVLLAAIKAGVKSQEFEMLDAGDSAASAAGLTTNHN